MVLVAVVEAGACRPCEVDSMIKRPHNHRVDRTAAEHLGAGAHAEQAMGCGDGVAQLPAAVGHSKRWA